MNTRFARVYIRNLFPENSIHPFTQCSFSFDLQRFRVWRLWFQSVHTGSKAFTRAVIACEGLKEQAFTPGNRLAIRRKSASTPPMLWILEISSLHTRNLWKSRGNKLRVKWWMLFSGIKKRIEERKSLGRNGQIASCPLLQKTFNSRNCFLFDVVPNSEFKFYHWCPVKVQECR